MIDPFQRQGKRQSMAVLPVPPLHQTLPVFRDIQQRPESIELVCQQWFVSDEKAGVDDLDLLEVFAFFGLEGCVGLLQLLFIIAILLKLANQTLQKLGQFSGLMGRGWSLVGGGGFGFRFLVFLLGCWLLVGCDKEIIGLHSILIDDNPLPRLILHLRIVPQIPKRLLILLSLPDELNRLGRLQSVHALFLLYIHLRNSKYYKHLPASQVRMYFYMLGQKSKEMRGWGFFEGGLGYKLFVVFGMGGQEGVGKVQGERKMGFGGLWAIKNSKNLELLREEERKIGTPESLQNKERLENSITGLLVNLVGLTSINFLRGFNPKEHEVRHKWSKPLHWLFLMGTGLSLISVGYFGYSYVAKAPQETKHLFQLANQPRIYLDVDQIKRIEGDSGSKQEKLVIISGNLQALGR